MTLPPLFSVSLGAEGDDSASDTSGGPDGGGVFTARPGKSVAILAPSAEASEVERLFVVPARAALTAAFKAIIRVLRERLPDADELLLAADAELKVGWVG